MSWVTRLYVTYLMYAVAWRMEEEGKGGWDGSVTYHRVVDLPICIYLLGKKQKAESVVKYIAWRVFQHVVVCVHVELTQRSMVSK